MPPPPALPLQSATISTTTGDIQTLQPPHIITPDTGYEGTIFSSIKAPDSGAAMLSSLPNQNLSLSKFSTPLPHGRGLMPHSSSGFHSIPSDDNIFISHLEHRSRRETIASTPLQRKDLAFSRTLAASFAMDDSDNSGSLPTIVLQQDLAGGIASHLMDIPEELALEPPPPVPFQIQEKEHIDVNIEQMPAGVEDAEATQPKPPISEELLLHVAANMAKKPESKLFVEAVEPTVPQPKPPVPEEGEHDLANIPRIQETLTSAQPPQPPTICDDDVGWYKDWESILRERQNMFSYAKTTAPAPKRRRPRIKRPPRRLVDEMELPAEAPAADKTSINADAANALQQFFHGVMPHVAPPPPPTLPPPSNPTRQPDLETVSTQQPPLLASPDVDNETIDISAIAPQQANASNTLARTATQESYHRFILENTEEISIILENFEQCCAMFNNYTDHLEEMMNGDVRQNSRLYEPEILLNAPRKRLDIKLNIIQNLVRLDSFDFTQLPVVDDRMAAAIGFAFVLELKAAALISLSSDGRTIGLL